MPAEFRELDIQGISTLHVDRPGPTSAWLTFRVGHRDEPATIHGITHLAEHVIFRRMGPIVPQHDGVTSPSTVTFSVTGTAEETATYLNLLTGTICRRGFTQAEVDLEKWVIEAELPAAVDPSVGLLGYRYGTGTIGNAHSGTPSLGSVSAAEVDDWVARWFVTQNAVLSVLGPLPQLDGLALPDGTASAPDPARSLIAGPTIVASRKEGVAVSLVVPASQTFTLRDALMAELDGDLRRGRALFYSTDAEVQLIDAETSYLGLVLDPLEPDVDETARRVVEVVRTVAERGFSDHAHAVALSACRSFMKQPSAIDECAEDWGEQRLLGRAIGLPDTYLGWAESSTPASLTAALRGALPTLLIAVDRDESDVPALAEELGLTLLEERSGHASDAARRGPGRLWRGRFNGWFTDWCRLDGSTLYQHVLGETRAIDLKNIAVAGRYRSGDLVLIDHRGQDDVVPVVLWSRPTELIEAILAQVPAENIRDFSWNDDRPERPEVAAAD